MISLSIAEHIAWSLNVSDPGTFSFLLAEKTVFFSRPPKEPFGPHSSVTRLIQGIYDGTPDMARKLLRERIYTTARATEICRAMVRVAAKRLTEELRPVDHGFKIPYFFQEVSPAPLLRATFGNVEDLVQRGLTGDSPQTDQQFIRLGQRLAAETQTLGPLYKRDRSVAAFLVSKEGRILHWAINSNARNRTLHAEVNLLQSYFEKEKSTLPPSSKIIVTLKPCKMCAAMIWKMSCSNSKTKVIYGKEDLGPGARGTILDSGSNERRSWAKTEEETRVNLLFPII